MSEPLNIRPTVESDFVDLTPQGLRTVRRWAMSITIGSFLFGFDTGIISGALLFIRDDFGLSSLQQSSVVSVLLLGAVAGALVSGRIADRYGRRPLLAGLGVLFFLGIVVAALANGYWMLLLGRVILGLAVGGVSATVPTYLGEMAPAQIRGRVLSLNQLLITIGLLASYLVNWLFAESEQWRGMFWVGGIPSALLVLMCLWLPESPTWQITHGRTDRARRTLDKVTEPGGADLVVARLDDTDRAGEQDGGPSASGSGGVRALWAPAVRPALLVGVVLAALQQFGGINTILYYAPTIMGEAGLSASNAIYYSVFIGVVNVVVTVVSVYLVDRVGRRPLLLVSLVGMGISIALLGVAFSAELTPVLMLAFMMLYIVAFGVGMGPVFWVLLGEIFPPAQRAEGSGAGSTVNWFSNFVVSLLFLPLISLIGEGPTFWIFAVVCALGVVFVAKWVPETRGRNIDEVGEDLHRRWNAPAA
ncbi:sugar porter family MFS transporter [Streptomyces prasinopilosus]|uniref:MFS transporter, sugar porter (SP) family n=1 Tax=Streptomyces prasinopilosus TaxID=67344 RepID=A0A1G6VM16_9ACTN|nr:sugar porter family MFS transporter [Streptomyces prasinopilosus]SDD54629.1 MFS transporter, sugar porter (SP) family [Streptomyces prasinopilosus]